MLSVIIGIQGRNVLFVLQASPTGLLHMSSVLLDVMTHSFGFGASGATELRVAQYKHNV